MVDIGTIAAAVSGLNTAREMTQALISIRDAAVFNEKAIELQGVIFTAQSNALAAQAEQFTLLDQVRQLKEKMTDLETWNTEKEKYELQEIASGCLAYTRKGDAHPTEPAHHICADCYQHGQKSILQTVRRVPGPAEVLFCQQCGWEVYISGRWRPEHGGRSKKN